MKYRRVWILIKTRRYIVYHVLESEGSQHGSSREAEMLTAKEDCARVKLREKIRTAMMKTESPFQK